MSDQHTGITATAPQVPAADLSMLEPAAADFAPLLAAATRTLRDAASPHSAGFPLLDPPVVADSPERRLALDPDNVKKGLGQLVMTLVKLLHELLERQALRRIDAGSLTDEQIEAIGTTLMRQAEEIRRLCVAFGLQESDLNLDLGPLGKLI